jgi:hypothetical protein
MLVTLWDRQTGEAMVRDSVDAREILARAPELYTDQNPNPSATPAVPENVSAADEYRREPVSWNTPEAPRAETILRNATGAPRPALGVAPRDDHFVRARPRV